MNKINTTTLNNIWLRSMMLILFLTSIKVSIVKAQTATYTCEAFNANIPGYPVWTAGSNFKTPTVDWTEGRLTGSGAAPNDFQWVNAGANPVAANQNIAGFPAGAGFVRYINRTVAYPSVSGAVNGDAAYLATRSLDWSGHTTYNATTDTFGISVWRDNTAATLAVLDYIEVYVNTNPSLSGAALALTTGGANKIYRSSTQTPLGSTGSAWNRYRFVIPNDVRFYGATGATSSAYIIIAGYSSGGNNIFLDNINMPQWPTQMQVTSASVFATQNFNIGANSTNNLMLGVRITTKGSLSPRRLDGILFNTIGSTAYTTDVVQPTGPKCWFTGAGSAFATTAGSVSVPKVNPSSPTYNNATLFFGTLDAVSGCPTALTPASVTFYPGSENFVWLAYDIAAGAVPGHYVGAGFEQLFTGWSAPGAAGCFNDTIITSAGIQTPPSFASFTPYPSVSAIRQIGGPTYNIPSYTGGTSSSGGGYYNNDFVSGVQIFGDNSTSIDNYLHDSICNSCVLVGGQNCQRFSCHPPDYTQFNPVNMGIYKQRAVQVSQGRGVRTGTAPYVIKAQCGTWFSANTIGIFIDWNNDGDFDDRYSGVGGFIYENYGSKQQVQSNMTLPVPVWGPNTSWNIDVPSPSDVVTDLNQGQPCVSCSQDLGPVIVGNVRMRIREVYAAPNSTAGVIGVHPTNSGYTYGEVEDYTIQVLPDCPSIGSNVCKWVGATNDWNSPNNWCPAAVPTKNDIAYIATGPTYMPVIFDNTTAVCRNLRIMPGANLKINATHNSTLKVYDDVEIGSGATPGTGSYIAVNSDNTATLTIPNKSSVPPAGLALATITPLRNNYQTKTQISYDATELATAYGWKAGDIIDQISIEVNSCIGGAGTATFQNLRIRAFLTTGASPVQYPFPATPSTKIAVEAGDVNVKPGWPVTVYGPTTTAINMPMATAGTQAGGNYYTFNLIPNTLIWDGVSHLVLSIETSTPSGALPGRGFVLYDEPNGQFRTLAVTYNIAGAVITGYTIDGAGHYSGGTNAGITATVSNQRPRLDFKWHSPYDQFPITVGGDWINNNRNVRTTVYYGTPLYGIPGDSGFIAGKSKVIFNPAGRSTVNSPGLAVSNPAYYTGIPGVTLSTDIDQEITSVCTTGGNSTVFGSLQINKISASGKVVKQVSTFNPYLAGHYADTLILTNGELNLNRKTFTLQKNSANALKRTNGWIRSEDNAGASPGTIESKFTWKIGTGTTGTYSIPFKNTTTGTALFNFKYIKNTAADTIGDLTVGTYSTATNNTPYTFPLLPAGNPLHVLNMLTNPAPVLDATPWTVDRFWFVKRSTTGSLTAGSTISFEYDNAVEGTSTSAYTAGEMKAQRYEVSPADTGWHAPFAGQTDNVVSGNRRVVNHPAEYVDNIYNIWAVVHTNALQPPLGGIGCIAATPIITPNGPLTFCNGSVILTSSPASFYSWSTGASTQSITVSTSGSYVVTITDASGCIGVSAPTVVSASIVAPTIIANGSTTICQNDSVQLTSTAATTYTWSTGATTQSIYAKTAATYYVVVANASGCTALSNSIAVTVNTLPAATITAGGPTTFCYGDSVSLTSSTGATYLWSTGATTKKIYAYNTGSYVVTVTKTNGCSKTSAPVAVTASQSTPPTIIAGGPITFCLGGSVILTSSAAASYTWSTGATTQSINVTISGSYYVITGSGSGCSAQSGTINVTVNQAAVPVVSATGPLTFCPGQNVILTSSPSSSYLWSTGITTQSIAVSSTGTYQVTITDGSGCTASSVPAIVNVICVKPVGLSTTNITTVSAKTNWGIVSCAIGYRVQYRANGTLTWTTKNSTTNFKNLIGLQSSTQYDWRVATKCPDGSYSAYTAIQHFTTLVIKADGMSLNISETDFSLYPNPTDGTFTVQFNSLVNAITEMKIYNTLGEVVYAKTIVAGEGENINVFNIENVPSGIYFIDLRTGGETMRSKLIKE